MAIMGSVFMFVQTLLLVEDLFTRSPGTVPLREPVGFDRAEGPE